MSGNGAQSWSVKGIDPKVREAAREAAAKQGMSLGEYLNQALANNPVGGSSTPTQTPTTPGTPRRPRYSLNAPDGESEDDWTVGDGSSRVTDPARLVQRIESIERRTQLAVSGLDRAVSTIDRSVLGLAARIEDAEAVSGEAADRISDALDQFRLAGDTLGAKLQRAESEIVESRQAFDEARSDIDSAKHRLEAQVSVAEEVARRAEAAASYLTNELENRDTNVRETFSATLVQARAAAEEAARQANEASSDAIAELRRLQEDLSDRLVETETSTRRAVASAIEEVRAEQAQIGERSHRAETDTQALKQEYAALITRIERAEAGSREATAGLRQAAGAAIADLRNAQLTLTARLKQVEESGGSGITPDLSGLKHQQQDIAERLAALESKTDHSPVTDALAAFERRLAAAEAGSGSSAKLDHVDGAVKTLDLALSRLAERIAETESTANTAIRTLEETVSSLGARVEQNTGVQETEAVRALLEQRLDTMAQSVHQMVGEARTELAGQLQSALNGVHEEGLEGALSEVNQRLAAAERRQAQTIEAISLEIKRMSETVDKRLRSVEARNDDAAASAVREELARMSVTLEQRFDEIERREAAAFDRMGLEVGRLSERLEERVGTVESRSAQAIEHVGEQVARVAERFNQRQDQLARELSERMLDSEDRAGSRVTEAISSIMQRLAEVEQHSAEAIAPVQKAVTGVAAKLEQFENAHDRPEPTVGFNDAMPTPNRRLGDFEAFGDPTPPLAATPEPFVSPLDAAKPTHAGPLPPRAPEHDDIYFAEDDLIAAPVEEPRAEPASEIKSFDSMDDDLLIDDHAAGEDTFTDPPPQDDDPFWSPDSLTATPPATAAAPPPTDDALIFDENDFDVPLAHTDPLDVHAATDDDAHELTHTAPEAEALASTEPPLPPGKNDYLAQARKVAQAQSLPKQKEKPAKAAKAPKIKEDKLASDTPKLRGSSRVVLWGSAGLISLLLIGGAWYFGGRPQAPAPAPEPAVTPTHVLPPPTVDQPAPQDPFADTTQAVDPNAAAPVGATPTTPTTAAGTRTTSTQPPVVAGPLPARNVSLEAAAQTGDAVAQYQLGLQRLSAGRTQDGVTLLRHAADRGVVMAQYRMAKVYERGESVTVDLSMARQWTERAAAGGNRRAMHDLGVYFARGEGAPLDEAAAFRWFRQAAELGVADSQYNLGVLYQQGRGVGASATEALFWFSVAARQGDNDAAAHATALEAQLSPQQAQQAHARAEAFRPRAASAIANGDFGPRPWDVPATTRRPG